MGAAAPQNFGLEIRGFTLHEHQPQSKIFPNLRFLNPTSNHNLSLWCIGWSL
jgi:hypothetical protein